MKKVALITLGCAKNLVDSEVMLGFLERSGYIFVSNPEEADIIIINTCGFIRPAREEALDAIKKAVELKRESKRKKIIVTGCYVQKDRETLKKEFHDIDAWIGVSDFDKITHVVEEKSFDRAPDCFLYSHTSPRLLSTPPSWAYVKISEGCSHRCSFCVIPQIKGSYRSRSISSIVKEVRGLVSMGIEEINLISQDSTSFGRDKRMKEGLVHLLKELLRTKDLGWIRILYGYPEGITDPLLEIMQEDKICSYLDIPFQHSDPRILRNMKRGITGMRSLRLLEKIRKKLPDVSLRTSLIVGFPGEDRKEFIDLQSFVKNARFDHLGVFCYSPEKETECFSLGNPVHEREKERRRERIMQLQAQISFDINKKYLNKEIEVLIEGTLKQDASLLVGRGRFQAPEVDGFVFIPARGKTYDVVNSIQKVEITDRDVYDLYGNLLP